MRRFLTWVVGACVLFSGSVLANWEFSEKIDPMTDEDTSMAALFHGRNEGIVVRCNGKSDFDIMVGVGEYVGSKGAYQVSYRFDKDKPENGGAWSTDTEGTVVFVPDRIKHSMLVVLKKRSDVTFQVTDHRGLKPYSTFSLIGSSAAIEKLSCI